MSFGSTPERSSAADPAAMPSLGADSEARPPPSLAKGVRAVPRTTVRGKWDPFRLDEGATMEHSPGRNDDRRTLVVATRARCGPLALPRHPRFATGLSAHRREAFFFSLNAILPPPRPPPPPSPPAPRTLAPPRRRGHPPSPP